MKTKKPQAFSHCGHRGSKRRRGPGAFYTDPGFPISGVGNATLLKGTLSVLLNRDNQKPTGIA
jgi:hypothetical protein